MGLFGASLGDRFDPATLSGALIYALIFLVLGVVAIRFVRSVTRRTARRFSDPTGIVFVSQLTQVGIFLAAIILYAQLIPALRSFGTAILTGVSIAGIIVGLAAQSTLGNLIAGISLLLYRPFDVGDQIELNTPRGIQTGVIQSLGLGYTVVKNADSNEIVVPNSVMAGAVIIKLGTTGRT